MKNKILIYTLLSFVVVYSCKKDDESDDFTPTPIRDRAEQQIDDDAALLEYFNTHYYNSQELADIFADTATPDPKASDIVITELVSGENVPDGHTLLSDPGVLITRETNHADTDYKYYILNINQGGGVESPNFCDEVRVNYFGSYLDGEVFDSTANPEEFDLINVIRGWQIVMPEFNVSESVVNNSDGTVTYSNYGLGVMFLPSGLGYYVDVPLNSGIPLYASLIFKVEMLETELADHDMDNVPSYIEDYNNNLFFEEDTDEDTFVDFLDSDDDGDGTLTIDEDLEDTDLTFDSDGDGDPTNDKNGDGDPTNDDTDGDGIPNYLDTDDSESRDN